jgi:hypothetical protein
VGAGVASPRQAAPAKERLDVVAFGKGDVGGRQRTDPQLALDEVVEGFAKDLERAPIATDCGRAQRSSGPSAFDLARTRVRAEPTGLGAAGLGDGGGAAHGLRAGVVDVG